MKIIKSINGLAALLAGICLLTTFSANAQTNVSSISDLTKLLGDIGISSNPSNYAAALFVGHSLSGTGKWSEGLVVAENINNNVGVCVGFDTLQGGGKIGSANIVSGGLTLKAQTHPLSFLSTNAWAQTAVTPYAIAMVGTPINGTGSANGGLCAVNRVGILVDYHTTAGGWVFSGGIDYGNRQYAGNYSGSWFDVIPICIRKNF